MKKLLVLLLVAIVVPWIPTAHVSARDGRGHVVHPVMSGDPQYQCVRSTARRPYDPGPFLRAHGATVLRLIVSDLHKDGVFVDGHMIIPPYAQMLFGTVACANRAAAEGYPLAFSFQYDGSQTPAEIAAWIAQVLPLYPHLYATGFGNEQDTQGIHNHWVYPSMVTTRKGQKTVDHAVETQRLKRMIRLVQAKPGAPRPAPLVWLRVHAQRVFVHRFVKTARRRTVKRATSAQQYRLDYNAAEPIMARDEPHSIIIFGDPYPLGRAWIVNAWALGGRPRGVGAIGSTGYWTWGIRPMAVFAAYMHLPFFVLENNPNGPGGSLVPAQRLYPAELAEIHSYCPNFLLDDFYS